MIGILFSLQSANAVWSIILKLSARALSKVRVSYFVAVGSFSGSAVYTPSTLVPLRSASASISHALRAEAESVVKKGLPVPPAMIATPPFSISSRAFSLA